MKKRYTFLPKTWLRFGLAAAVAASFSLNLQAQTAPVKQWDKTFGGNSNESLTILKQTSDGGYILGGSSASGISGDKSQPSNGSADFWVIKLDVNGNNLWDKSIGGIGGEQLYDIQQTADGGYILAGYSDSGISGDKSQPSKGGYDYWIVKLDANGSKTWDKTYGGSDNDALLCIQQTSDGGYLLGGNSTSGFGSDKSQASFGVMDYWVIKLDSFGNKIWDKAFGGSNQDAMFSLKQTADGGYILGGYSGSGISGNKSQASKGMNDYWIIKLDATGNITWDKAFGGSNFDFLITVDQTPDGGYILGGTSVSGISGDKSQAAYGYGDYWVLKVNANGAKVWDKSFGGTGDDLLKSLKQTTDGGYIVGGQSGSDISGSRSEPSRGADDFWVLKLDSNGNNLWDKALGGNSFDRLYSLIQTTDGGYLLGGETTSSISGDKSQASRGGSDYWIVKLSGSPTGLKELEASYNLSISPNPNQGKFNLQLSNLKAPKAEVTISDLLGRVVLQKEIQTANNQLSEELTLPNAKGIYLLQIKASEQILTRKIVVE